MDVSMVRRVDHTRGRTPRRFKERGAVRPYVEVLLDEVLMLRQLLNAQNERLANALEGNAVLSVENQVLRAKIEALDAGAAKKSLACLIKGSDDEIGEVAAAEAAERLFNHLEQAGFKNYSDIKRAVEWLADNLAHRTPWETNSFLCRMAEKGTVRLAQLELAMLGWIGRELQWFLGEEVCLMPLGV